MTESCAAEEWSRVTRLEIYGDDEWCQVNRAMGARLWGDESVSESQFWQVVFKYVGNKVKKQLKNPNATVCAEGELKKGKALRPKNNSKHLL